MDLGFVNFCKLMILNMLESLDNNGMMISERDLVLKHVKHRVILRQIWRAVKIRWYITVGDELDHEFLV